MSEQSTTNPMDTRRFRTNPVEILILLTMVVVVGNSAYNLLYGTDSFRPAALKPMAANPVSEGRAPASAQVSSFANLEIKCVSNEHASTGPMPASLNHQETLASKVRLMGTLCGADGQTGSQLLKATDYIPLAAGKNMLHLEFSYRGGKTTSQDVTVSKIDETAPETPAPAADADQDADETESD